ncbi:MAG: MmgE/PrpD family protein, partial [Anaerolineales bacterium]
MNILEFIHELTWNDLPGSVRHQALRCLLDTLGAGIGGRTTDLSRIVHDFAALAFGGRGAHLWQDGREVSPPGAALANGMTVDALDIHDGHMLTKGHAGAAIVPAALAILNLGQGKVSGQELLILLVAGYEVAIRAGVALHATVSDYHTSGAWNALGCAALTARRLGLNAEATRHALGIAEYHGPRSQMMRCIDYPTMLKDGSGCGAMAGVSAGMLAAGGFTGAPAITVEAANVAHFWTDLGTTWHVLDQYFKPHATCRWAQPAAEGALAIQHAHQLRPDDIARIRVTTFYEATQLNHPRPATTEEAQYSLPFPVAAALFHHGLGPAALSGQALHDEAVLSLADRVELAEDPALSARFPAERVARVRVETTEGQYFELEEVKPRWEASAPPTDEELRAKFRWLAAGQLPQARAEALEGSIWN